jgi:hypothetical protein
MSRRLWVHPENSSRLLRAGQTRRCRYCGNYVDWHYKADGSPVPLVPQEFPARQIPDGKRWHLSRGTVYPGDGGSRFCRIAHTAVCPAADESDTHPRLLPVRRHLAVHSRKLVETGTWARPAEAPTVSATRIADHTTSGPDREVALILGVHYLAPGRIATLRCVALTPDKRRCPGTLLAATTPADAGRWRTVPVPYSGGLGAQFAGEPMDAYDLSALTYAQQLRWRWQHCMAHDRSVAPDIELTEWIAFNATDHAEYIRKELG